MNKIHGTEIQNSLKTTLLLLLIEISQQRWFGHVNGMPQNSLSRQAFSKLTMTAWPPKNYVLDWDLVKIVLLWLIITDVLHLRSVSPLFSLPLLL